ncbi:glycosyl hydrolase [Microbulbifer agarilyticus]
MELVGAGSISRERVGTQFFNWEEGDRADRSPPSQVYLTENFTGPIPSNDWASSLVVDRYSKALHAHPMAYRATEQGFEISMPPVTIGAADGMGETSVRRTHGEHVDLLIRGDGFQPEDARVARVTDWTYEVVMAADDRAMQVTIGHGLPYAYFSFTNAQPVIDVLRGTQHEIVSDDGNALMLRLLDSVDNQFNYYGVFLPAGTTYNQVGSRLELNLPAARQYLTIAGLPDGTNETWALFKSRAYNVVTDSRVDWLYDETDGRLLTTYTVATQNHPESTEPGTLFALLPHQWRNSNANFEAGEFDSIRGRMKLVAAGEFRTSMPYHGILPELPRLATAAGINTLTGHLTDYYGYGFSLTPKFIQPGVDGANSGYDTYWMGKNLNRLSGLVAISDQLDDANPELVEITDTMFDALKGQLEYWFNAGKPTPDNYFYYDDHWGTLIGYPSSYDTDTDLNDHHFHYGYWINAAAQIALRDPDWAAPEVWGGMVYELIGDIANSDRNNTRYPFLRNFDPYEGHSWASGVVPYVEDGFYPEGNNNEASSEAINAWAGLILWGEAVGDRAVRDLGIYLYTHEVEAANTYWFNLYGDVGHPDYPNEEISRLWGGGYDHSTWWTEDPIQTHGINMLPITGASMYLGKNPEFVQRNYDAIWSEYALWDGDNGIFDKTLVRDRWQDITSKYIAFVDPQFALDTWKSVNQDEDPMNGVDPALGIEFGESRAHTYQHIKMLDDYGLPDFSIRPVEHVLGFVLNKNGAKTYVAYNADDTSRTLKFSDGMGLIDVPAKSLAQGPGSPVDITPPVDSDSDGVPDRDDLCPVTSVGSTVNSVGCPDSDGDGVFDNLDLCVLTPNESPVDAQGCPDSDRDGVPDSRDLCSETPDGQQVDSDGCAMLDEDGDGVTDTRDLCPGTAADVEVDGAGCPIASPDPVIDSDGDGVPDILDICPGTTSGASVDVTGCVIEPALWGLAEMGDGQGILFLNTTGWADAHYRINAGAQLNVRMQQTGARNEFALFGLSPGDQVAVFFTYYDSECACVIDSAQVTFTYASTISPDPEEPENPVAPLPDSDSDGVADEMDQCPDTVGGTQVDALGCPLMNEAAYGATVLGDGVVELFVEESTWADTHYRVNAGQQLNVRMIQSGERSHYSINGLASGDMVSYYFTYWDPGCACAVDTSWQETAYP